MDVLVTDILANGDLKNAKKLQDIFHRLSNTFSDPEDVASIMKFLGEPAVKNNMGQLMSTLSGIEPETLKNAAKTFGKIQPENMPKIDSLLKELNVTLASFISDPGILFSFFGDPEKAKIMMEVQQLLPLFTPEDLESVLNIKVKKKTFIITFSTFIQITFFHLTYIWYFVTLYLTLLNLNYISNKILFLFFR